MFPTIFPPQPDALGHLPCEDLASCLFSSLSTMPFQLHFGVFRPRLALQHLSCTECRRGGAGTPPNLRASKVQDKYCKPLQLFVRENNCRGATRSVVLGLVHKH
uniref:Uncharacterized protein n=1 Tax=Micrurus spixii TaxID=129469 RepID=A0A2D4MZQ3_9SAUR